MNIEQAIEHLSYRMQGKHFNPNAKDIAAMNSIIKYFNAVKVQKIDNNRLFAKLFMELFNGYMWKYRDLPYQMCIDKIIDIMAKPLDDHLSEARRVTNAKEYLKACKHVGITLEGESEFGTMTDFAHYYKDNQAKFKEHQEELSKSVSKFGQAAINDRFLNLLSDMLIFHSESP